MTYQLSGAKEPCLTKSRCRQIHKHTIHSPNTLIFLLTVGYSGAGLFLGVYLSIYLVCSRMWEPHIRSFVSLCGHSENLNSVSQYVSRCVKFAGICVGQVRSSCDLQPEFVSVRRKKKVLPMAQRIYQLMRLYSKKTAIFEIKHVFALQDWLTVGR